MSDALVYLSCTLILVLPAVCVLVASHIARRLAAKSAYPEPKK